MLEERPEVAAAAGAPSAELVQSNAFWFIVEGWEAAGPADAAV